MLSIVSPSALIGCMKVDSVYMPSTVPVLDSSLKIESLDVTLWHNQEVEGIYMIDHCMWLDIPY